MTPLEIHTYLRSPKKPELRYFPHAVAAQLGELAALLLYDIHGRLERRREPLMRDDRSWVFDTMEVFAASHLYASESGIRKAFLALEQSGYIEIEKSGKYNRMRYDKKWWYCITPKGRTAATIRRIRFAPDVAQTLDIPKAVLLESLRFHLHKNSARASVEMDPSVLPLPYSDQTIQRHLNDLVKDKFLEREPNSKIRYLVAAFNEGQDENELLRVPIEKLLPKLESGKIGLLVGHSGVGKTSYACFVANQYAASGVKVLYVSLEEPIRNIRDRIIASEFGLRYTALHIGDAATVEAANKRIRERPQQTVNLRFLDLKEGTTNETAIRLGITNWKNKGFDPDIVIIDQLEFIIQKKEENDAGYALPSARGIEDCLGKRDYATWVIHQANGSPEWDFSRHDVSGGQAVLQFFDRAIGIGRDGSSGPALRLFSLSGASGYENIMDADINHMRFRPRI